MNQKLTLTSVKAASPKSEDVKIWDTLTKGFGLKVTPTGRKVYFLKYRFGRRQRWYTIGAHGSPWTPETARDEAVRIAAQTLDSAGEDPFDLEIAEQPGLPRAFDDSVEARRRVAAFAPDELFQSRARNQFRSAEGFDEFLGRGRNAHRVGGLGD